MNNSSSLIQFLSKIKEADNASFKSGDTNFASEFENKNELLKQSIELDYVELEDGFYFLSFEGHQFLEKSTSPKKYKVESPMNTGWKRPVFKFFGGESKYYRFIWIMIVLQAVVATLVLLFK